jgi:hypothetical protein
MVPEQLGPEKRKVTLHEILANMTQVSDVVPGPLISLSDVLLYNHKARQDNTDAEH